MAAFADGERPLDEIADVRKNVERGTRLVAGAEVGEVGGSAAQRLTAAIGEGGESVAKEILGFVHSGLLKHLERSERSLPARHGQGRGPSLRSGSIFVIHS